MKRLGKEQVIRIHSILIEQTCGSDGIRDEGLLDSALNAPFQTFDGEYIYKTIKAKAAKLGYFLVKNHPFIDGNKRIGILVMISFLEINGVEVICTDEELITLGLGLADGSINDEDLLKWIIDHSWYTDFSFHQGGNILLRHLYCHLNARWEYNSDDVLWFRGQIKGFNHNM